MVLLNPKSSEFSLFFRVFFLLIALQDTGSFIGLHFFIFLVIKQFWHE